MFGTECLNSSKDNQRFWHRYNKLTGNKTINIVEYTTKMNTHLMMMKYLTS